MFTRVKKWAQYRNEIQSYREEISKIQDHKEKLKRLFNEIKRLGFHNAPNGEEVERQVEQELSRDIIKPFEVVKLNYPLKAREIARLVTQINPQEQQAYQQNATKIKQLNDYKFDDNNISNQQRLNDVGVLLFSLPTYAKNHAELQQNEQLLNELEASQKTYLDNIQADLQKLEKALQESESILSHKKNFVQINPLIPQRFKSSYPFLFLIFFTITFALIALVLVLIISVFFG